MSVTLNTNNAARGGMLVRRYGAGTCPFCAAVHDDASTLVESGGSKAYVEVLFANMLSAMPNLSSKQKKEAKCMIGALVPSGPGQVLIAVSGVGVRAAFTQAALLMPKAFVCGPVDPPVTTRGGRAITPGELSAMKVDNEPLQCAAPKLIMEARKRTYRMPWDMTEIWFDAQMNERHKHKAVGYTKHGWSIASCATCTNVVPALMCTLAS